jgi:hypothetical protein
MQAFEIEAPPSSTRTATARDDLGWRSCVAYAFLAGIFILEFVRTADQTLKDRAFALALDTLNHSVTLFKDKTSG